MESRTSNRLYKGVKMIAVSNLLIWLVILVFLMSCVTYLFYVNVTTVFCLSPGLNHRFLMWFQTFGSHCSYVYMLNLRRRKYFPLNQQLSVIVLFLVQKYSQCFSWSHNSSLLLLLLSLCLCWPHCLFHVVFITWDFFSLLSYYLLNVFSDSWVWGGR